MIFTFLVFIKILIEDNLQVSTLVEIILLIITVFSSIEDIIHWALGKNFFIFTILINRYEIPNLIYLNLNVGIAQPSNQTNKEKKSKNSLIGLQNLDYTSLNLKEEEV